MILGKNIKILIKVTVFFFFILNINIFYAKNSNQNLIRHENQQHIIQQFDKILCSFQRQKT